MSVNKVILVGRIGKDVELKNGVAKTSLATTEKIKNKQNDEYETTTEWHNLVFFGSLANIANQFLNKGSQVYIEGKIKTSEYTKDNIKRYSTSIIVNSLQMLGSKKDYEETSASHKPLSAPTFNDKDNLEDDLPF